MGYASARRVRKFSQGSQAVAGGRKRSQAVGSPPKTLIFKAFWDFPWPKTRQHGLKMGQKHLFKHPKWSGNNFRENDFFRPGDPNGLTVGTRRARAWLPPGSTK